MSRIDLYADFVSSVDMESWDRHAWVTRASSINAYAVSGHFSGWSIGLGGVMSARLYNKSLEILTSNKDWILPLWHRSAWDGKSRVWRLEFELKREVLNHLNGLWSYATTEWLRLTVPNEDDQTRSRWPIHPLWLLLASIDWETPGGPLLKRFHPSRSPKDNKLFQAAYSAFLSYIAKHRLIVNSPVEFRQGVDMFLGEAFEYHEQQAHYQGTRFEELAEQAQAYRKASGH